MDIIGEKLGWLLDRWKALQTPELFAEIVKEGTTGFCAFIEVEVVIQQEISLATIRRWASGVSLPHPAIQRQVVQEIERLMP